MLLGFCTVSGGISTSMSALAADTSDSNQKSYYTAVCLHLCCFFLLTQLGS